MELLAMFGTEPQQRRWLDPLLDASIRSAYCMTEPDVASSDAGNIRTRIEATSHGFVVNGTKVWSTGALSTDCQLLVVMGVSDPEGEPRRRQSIVLIPRDAPGVEIRRGLTTYGFTDAAHGGHAEVRFTNVFVPREDLLGSPGDGGRLAQARLGPGRVHHCMRLIGMAERAFELMCRRANERSSFGRRLADQGVVQERVAQARVRIDQTRLLVLRTAWLIDTIGARAARTEISAIKVATPRMAEWVIDQAIQLHGAGGMTEDLPLAMLWAQARGLRFADGPDEVHEMVLGRRELARFAN
jgi:acyl-CoA dehydrogenase